MVVLLDFDEDGNMLVVNWNWHKKEGIEIVKLNKNYPVTMGYISYDTPDTEIDKKEITNMLRFLKGKTKEGVIETTVYMVDSDNKRHTFMTAESLYDNFGQNIRKYITVVAKEQIMELEEGEPFDRREKKTLISFTHILNSLFGK